MGRWELRAGRITEREGDGEQREKEETRDAVRTRDGIADPCMPLGRVDASKPV